MAATPHLLEMWVVFGIVITGMLIVDLAVLNRKAHALPLKESLAWVGVWVGAAVLFCAGIYFRLGSVKALEFLTGYLVEESLSVDNLFVFILIFSYFNVPRQHQPRVLKWGIIGAMVMRAFFISVGIGLFTAFHWIIYVFGFLLFVTAIKILANKEENLSPEKNPVVKVFKRFFPVAADFHKEHFFIRQNGILYATPLFITLLLIESSDIIFAIDSIPAVLAITKDPFIVYTSNIFAIMGLRALFFVVEGMMSGFRYLKAGISVILCFIGVKMVISDFYQINIGFSLGFVALVLVVSVLASILRKEEI